MHRYPALVSLVVLAACAPETGKVVGPGSLDGGAAGPGEVLLTVSGEKLALGGYPFPPVAADDVAFVDGWELQFSRVLVTVDTVRLAENPDRSPTDQAQTDAVVAELRGPWAVDLHRGGPLVGAGGGDERAVAIGVFRNQNKNGGTAFDLTKRYAFGFDLVAASLDAANVNLDETGWADYRLMADQGLTVLYVGTATFKGTGCRSVGSYDFTQLPGVVNFRFGFKAPATFVNCQNPLNTGKAFDNEESQRGVQVLANRGVVAQVTVHTDHPFWESFVHDAQLHFDPLAARAMRSDGVWTVTLDNLVGVDFTSFVDQAGATLPARSCVGEAYVPGPGALGYDPGTVPHDPGATSDRALRDFRDYVTYAVSTEGHLNADGLCAVRRNYPSPP
ncbi:MAG: hypothetical protein WCI05_06720 [Myxococcales bacterium]